MKNYFQYFWALTLTISLQLQAVLNLQVPVEHSKEVNDCKHLIKTLVMGNFSLILPYFLVFILFNHRVKLSTSFDSCFL